MVLALSGVACAGDNRAPERGATGTTRSIVPEAAPAFPDALTWFNVAAPLTLEELRGRVVLLDFWTLGCINCQQIIPDLKQLEDEFGNALVVIGVHSGKYTTEQDDASIREAIGKYGLRHPVVNDPDFAVWDLYGALAWPTLVLIDPAGNKTAVHVGEGVYAALHPLIDGVMRSFEARGELVRTPLAIELGATAVGRVLFYPAKVVADPAHDRIYIADSGHNRVLEATLSGRLLRAFGTGEEGFVNGGAAEAAFRAPQGLALSSDGATLFVADTRNHALRAIDLVTGEVTTLAGTGRQLEVLPVTDVRAKTMPLASPWDVLAAGSTLYVSMAGTHQIWALDLESGIIGVFAGTGREGIADGPRRQQATLAQPSGLATDGTHLYWADPESSAIRRVSLSLSTEGSVETLVGTGLFDFGDEDGVGLAALLQHPQGVAFADGALYVADTYNHKLRRLDVATRAVTTVAGGGRGWQDGAATSALFDEPGGVSVAAGRAYVADTNNHLIRTVDLASGEVSTLTLTNLGVAGAPGRAQSVVLPGQGIAAGAGSLRLTFVSPPGYHLNALAPSRVEFQTPEGRTIVVERPRIAIESDDARATVETRATFRDGTTPLTVKATIYYCRTGNEGLCLIHEADLIVPVTVSATATNRDLDLTYDLPLPGTAP
jgi:DNA-binding beta-propeller fold protein YncE